MGITSTSREPLCSDLSSAATEPSLAWCMYATIARRGWWQTEHFGDEGWFSSVVVNVCVCAHAFVGKAARGMVLRGLVVRRFDGGGW